MKKGIRTLGFFEIIDYCPYCNEINGFDKCNGGKVGICMACDKEFII